MVSARTQRLLAWSGPACIVVFLTGFWVIAGLVPPPSPKESAAEIAAFFASDTGEIRLGLWMTTFAAALVAPWTVVITMQLRRIEGPHPTLAYAQLALGTLLVMEFLIPLMVWQAAAFRPEASPEITYRLNDLAWLMFVGVVSTGVMQAFVIGLAILQDRNARPVFPRWLGYLNFWLGSMFMPGGLCVFFKGGPFAWNGLFAWWMLLTSFCVWVLVMSAMVLRNVAAHEPQEKVDGVPLGSRPPELGLNLARGTPGS